MILKAKELILQKHIEEEYGISIIDNHVYRGGDGG